MSFSRKGAKARNEGAKLPSFIFAASLSSSRLCVKQMSLAALRRW